MAWAVSGRGRMTPGLSRSGEALGDLGGGIAGTKQGGLLVVGEDAEGDGAGEMDANEVVGVTVAELAGDEVAPVASLGGEALVAQDIAHEGAPKVRGAPEVDAGDGERTREGEAGQGGHYDVEGVALVAAVGGGVAEGSDQLVVVPEAPGPAVREDERHGVGSPPFDVDEVDRNVVDGGGESWGRR